MLGLQLPRLRHLMRKLPMFTALCLAAFSADLIVDGQSWKGSVEKSYYGHVISRPNDVYDISEVLKKEGCKAAVIHAKSQNHMRISVRSDKANVALIPLSIFANECEKTGIKITVIYVLDTSNQSFKFHDDETSYSQRHCYYLSAEGMAAQKNCECIVIRASHPLRWSDEQSHAAEHFRRAVSNATKAITQ